jgi:hypothetical protein
VQQRSHEGLCIEFPFGALDRDGDRVGDVGLAAVAKLSQVSLVRVTVGSPNLFDVACTEIVETFGQRSKAGRGRVGCSQRPAFLFSGCDRQ